MYQLKDNSRDLGSRGLHPNKMSTNWLKDPDWVSSKENWPIQPEVTETDEHTIEKVTKEYLGLVATEQEENRVEALVHKLSYWKSLRVTVLVKKCVHNYKNAPNKPTGPLTADDVWKAEVF